MLENRYSAGYGPSRGGFHPNAADVECSVLRLRLLHATVLTAPTTWQHRFSAIHYAARNAHATDLKCALIIRQVPIIIALTGGS